MNLHEFAGNIQKISTAPVGCVFNFHAGHQDARAIVKVTGDNSIYINGKLIGGRTSAISYYTQMVRELLELYEHPRGVGISFPKGEH